MGFVRRLRNHHSPRRCDYEHFRTNNNTMSPHHETGRTRAKTRVLRVNIQCCGAPCHENRSTGVENSSAASSGVLGAFSDMRDDVVAAKAANNDSYNNTNACCLIANAGQDAVLASDICDRKLGEFSSYLILRCRASKTASLGRKFEYH